MAKTEPTTKPTGASVGDFIAAVDHPGRRADAATLLELYRDVSGLEPLMWGPSIIGFGRYHYETKSCAGDWPRTGFSARKANLVIYLTCAYQNPEMDARVTALRDRLGKHKMSVSCIYINKLADIDMAVLRELVELDIAWMDRKYPR